MEDILSNFLRLSDGSVNQAGGGNGVDLPGDACGELMDQVFDVRVKDFIRGAGRFQMEVYVCSGLSFSKGMHVVMYRDALCEVGMDVSFEDIFEVFLPREDDFEMSGRIKRRADKESEVCNGVGFQEMSLVDNDNGSEI